MNPGARAYPPGLYAGWSAPNPAVPGAVAQVYLGLPWQLNSFGTSDIAGSTGKIARRIIARPASAGYGISALGGAPGRDKLSFGYY